MANNKKRVYVVSVKLQEGRKLYFVREEMDTTKAIDIVLMSASKGIFSFDLKDAKKFLDYNQALWTASYFGGAGVESIKEGERLK